MRAVPLAEKEGAQCYEADPDNAYSGNYPLSRFLYVYVNRAPGKPLDPLTAAGSPPSGRRCSSSSMSSRLRAIS